jgi:hypothetical protein
MADRKYGIPGGQKTPKQKRQARKKKKPSAQQKHKYSVFTAVQDAKYNKWKNRRALEGKPVKSQEWWYKNVYKSGS